MNSRLNALAGFLLSQSLQIAVVFLIVMVACILLRRASAHWRYLLWLLVIAKCLTPPIITFSLPVLPSQQIAEKRSNEPAQLGTVLEQTAKIEFTDLYLASSTGSTSPTPTIEEPIASHTDSGSIQHVSNAKPRIANLSSQHWLALIWFSGVAVFLLIMVVKVWVTHRTIVRSRVRAQQEMQDVLSDLVRNSGLKRAPKLYEVDFAAQPFVWGWFRGDIYLSPNFSANCSREKCRTIIAHELAHVSRWDAAMNHVQNVVQALFFFHPLVWIANKRLRLEREQCCDEAVLSDSANAPRAYAEAIVDMLTYASNSTKSIPALAVTGAIKDIKTRLVTILTPNRSFLRRPSRASVITLILLAACVLPTFVVLTRSSVAVDDRNTQSDDIELKTFKWRFLDESVEPIEGVLVTVKGLYCEEDPSGYGWPTELVPKTEYASDAIGEVAIEYPTHLALNLNGQRLTTKKLLLSCKHEQYVSLENVEVDIAIKNFTRTLERGCQVMLTCRGPDGLPIKEFANVTPGWYREIWKLQDGELHSGNMPVGNTQTMLVVPDANGRHLFSQPIDLLCSKEEEFKSEIVVEPGMVLSGKIAENVPRPIENGKVIAFCVPKPLGPSFTTTPSVSWTDETIISADGSFEFASLPPSESVQLIALCRGWLADGWSDHGLVKGQVLAIDPDRIASKTISGLTLSMEQAGSLEVVVLDPDGKPVVGTEVACWPNQAYSHDSGTTLLGFCYSSAELVKSQIAGQPAPIANFSKVDRYNSVTDGDGKAVLREIPLNRPQFVQVFHKELELRDNPAADNFFRGIKYQCDSPEPKRMTVHMVRPEKAMAMTAVNSAATDQEKTKRSTPKVLTTKVAKFDFDLLSQEQFTKSMQERVVTISPTVRKAMLDYTESVENPNPQIENAIKALRDGKDKLTLENVASVLGLGDQSALDVAKQLREHNDPAVRFAANLTIATNAPEDLTAAQSLHKLIHDKSLQLADHWPRLQDHLQSNRRFEAP